jgi:hypothetical protein
MTDSCYLEQIELVEIRDALIDANLSSFPALDAILRPLNRLYVGGIPAAPAPNLYLWNILQTINCEHNLRNGDVPLAQFLSSAATLAGPSQAALILEEKLRKISYAPSAVKALAGQDIDGALDAAAAAQVTPEAQTNAFDQTVSVHFMSQGIEAARSVVKILVQRHFGSTPEFSTGDVPALVNGTAWFITDDLIITNHHVINARRKEGVTEDDATPVDFKLQADSARIVFDYVDKLSEPAPIPLGKDCLVYSNQQLDFALLRLPAAIERRRPLRLRKFVILKTPQQALGSGVNVLQHPNGNPMRLGFRNNYVVLGSAEGLSYLTDTAVGSSGSPVCDDSWSVAALHSGSRGISNRNIDILGHKYTRENFGIPISAILAHLKDNRSDVYDEVISHQP